jgi:apolipoprotein N-acyltransferase
MAGGPRTSGNPPPRYHNSAFLIAPDGEILARYDKERLLPFAEYFPFASVELLRREFGRVREFTPGTTPAPLPTAIGPAGVVICNEAMFPELVTARVRAGATFLVNLTNDSWLNDAQFSDQAFDMGRLRAVEQRRWLVRASTSGPSAIVDPFGRIVAQTRPFTRDTLDGTIQPSAALTLYARVGDAFAIGCAAVTLAGVLAGLRGRSRASGPAADEWG